MEQTSSVEQLINERYGEFIKSELSTDKDFDWDIYINLKYNLYENGESEQYFYDAMVTNISNKMNYQNYRIIDEDKQITIRVICNSDTQELVGYDINGDTNYYGHQESMAELKKYTKTQETDMNIESSEIQTLINSDWLLTSLKSGSSDPTDIKEMYYEKGIDITTTGKTVFNMVFNNTYTGAVINGITVGTSFDNIISILGTPTFGSEDDMYIGYKGQDIYVFFSDNQGNPQISVYMVEKSVSSDDFVKLLENFNEDGNIKTMVSTLTDYWPDYDNYYYNANTVDLWYTLKGIKVQFGVTSNQGILVYSNYIGKILQNYTQAELKDMQIQIPYYIFFTSKDSVNEYENTRVQSLNGDVEEPSDT
ncbi:MAG: hypothetical protein FWF46_02800 [Oscillospiraceae bacterium]|nr:hypothetical protein [Oscillospiraceae bacterium]